MVSNIAICFVRFVCGDNRICNNFLDRRYAALCIYRKTYQMLHGLNMTSTLLRHLIASAARRDRLHLALKRAIRALSHGPNKRQTVGLDRLARGLGVMPV